jgi:integral membrane protein
MNPEQIKTSKQIRLTGDVEGISYLVLLFIAMPLKYMAGMPEAVRIIGMAHGVLFLAFLYMIFRGYDKLNWSFGRMFFAFVLSLIPFGTFWLHRDMKQREA